MTEHQISVPENAVAPAGDPSVWPEVIRQAERLQNACPREFVVTLGEENYLDSWTARLIITDNLTGQTSEVYVDSRGDDEFDPRTEAFEAHEQMEMRRRIDELTRNANELFGDDSTIITVKSYGEGWNIGFLVSIDDPDSDEGDLATDVWHDVSDHDWDDMSIFEEAVIHLRHHIQHAEPTVVENFDAMLRGHIDPDIADTYIGAANDQSVFEQLKQMWEEQHAPTPQGIDREQELLYTSVVATIAAAEHGIPDALRFAGDSRVFLTMLMLSRITVDVAARYLAVEYADSQELEEDTDERELRAYARGIQRVWSENGIEQVDPGLDELHEAEFAAQIAVLLEEHGEENACQIVGLQRRFIVGVHNDGDVDLDAVVHFILEQTGGPHHHH